jgi:cytoskeletal protein RodZ
MVSSNYYNLTCVKRFVHRTPEELHHQANVSGPLPKKSVSNVPQQNEPESDDPPEHAPNRESSLLDPGHSSVAGSDLLQSSTVACIPVLPSTGASGSAVDIYGNGSENPNTCTAMPTGSISVSKVSAEQKEGMAIDSRDSFSVESNESVAGSTKATVSPLPECKESNEEIILVSYYANWTEGQMKLHN